MWQIEISDRAEADILKLDKPIRQRIIRFLRERVASHSDPKQLAEPLAGNYRGLWRFRIGDYRAIADIQGDKLVVIVLEVGHRGEIYR